MMIPKQVSEGGLYWSVFFIVHIQIRNFNLWCRVLSKARTSSLVFCTLKKDQNVLFVEPGVLLVQLAQNPA